MSRCGIELLTYVRQRWPVDTGTSRAAWAWEICAAPGKCSITLENPMFYASDITRDGLPDDEPLWSELIAEAWASIGQSFYEQILPEVDKEQDAIEAAVAGGMDRERAGFFVLNPYDGLVRA